MSDISDPTLESKLYQDPSTHQYPNPSWEPLLEHKALTTKSGFFRTWFATTADLRPTPDSEEVKWGIHWYTPVTIVFLLLLGLVSAAAHHVFYQQLHGKTVGDEDQQRRVFWIGSSLGFLAKVSFTAVLAISRTQWVWATLRKKSMTLGGIDALFGVSSDPTFFANLNMLRRAKFATLMAIMMWVLPLTAILSPGTISVKTMLQTSTLPCTVQSIRFPFDPNPTASLLMHSTVAKRMTVFTTGQWYATMPSSVPRVIWAREIDTLLALLTSYNMLAYPRPSLPPIDPTPSEIILEQICDYNCSYTVKFLGPALACSSAGSLYPDFPWLNPRDFLRGADYRAEMHKNNAIVIGVNTTPPTVIHCRKAIAQYTVRQVIQKHRFDQPIIVAVEQTQYIPQGAPVYPDTTYVACQVLLFNVGQVILGSVSPLVRFPRASVTSFYGKILKDPSNIGSLVEELAQRMTVSLLSFRRRPRNRPRGILDVAAFEDTNCTSTKMSTVYLYSAQTLVIIYSISAGAALWMALAGFFALRRNGVASNRSVSAIIRATRNPTLDKSIGGSCLGDPMPKELENLELQFGVLIDDSARSESNSGQRLSSFALGIKGEIGLIRRGGWYS